MTKDELLAENKAMRERLEKVGLTYRSVALGRAALMMRHDVPVEARALADGALAGVMELLEGAGFSDE
jgi:hypothetical protein